MSIIQKLIVAYKLWHEYWLHFDKLTRYSLGSTIDALFIEVIRDIFAASHRSHGQKEIYLTKASDEFDTLKFLFQIAWEIKALDNKKYIAMSRHLTEIGRMLGGWRKKTNAPR